MPAASSAAWCSIWRRLHLRLQDSRRRVRGIRTLSLKPQIRTRIARALVCVENSCMYKVLDTKGRGFDSRVRDWLHPIEEY